MEFEGTMKHWELVGVFSSEKNAQKARNRYMHREVHSSTAGWLRGEDVDIRITSVRLDDLHWLTVRRVKKEEAAAERTKREAEAAAKREAEERAARARADKMIQECRQKSIYLDDTCSEQDAQFALDLVDDARRCADSKNNPYWDDIKSAVSRRVTWIGGRLQGKLLNLDDYMPSFRAGLGDDFRF